MAFEFAAEGVVVSKTGFLYCNTCRSESVRNLQRNALVKHFKSKKQTLALSRNHKATDVLKMITGSYSEMNVELGYVSTETLSARRRLVRAVVGSGIAPNAILAGKFKSYLKSVTNIDISDKNHMIKDHLPAILKLEKKEITEELQGKEIAIVIDGTPFGGDLIATIVRCVNEKSDSAEVIVRLVDIYFAKSSVNSSELQGVLHRALGLVGCSIYNVKGIMADSVSVNTTAFSRMNQEFGLNIFVLLCMSHLFDNGGDLLAFPLCERLIKKLILVFTNSENSKSVWEQYVGRA